MQRLLGEERPQRELDSQAHVVRIKEQPTPEAKPAIPGFAQQSSCVLAEGGERHDHPTAAALAQDEDDGAGEVGVQEVDAGKQEEGHREDDCR